jgi:DNA-binding CsgD family transcriptional regulator
MLDAEPISDPMLRFENHLWELRQLAGTMSGTTVPVTTMSHIEFIEDGPKFTHLFASMQENATSTIRSLDRPPFVVPLDTQLPTELGRLRAGVEYRSVYDSEVMNMPELVSFIRTATTHGECARVLPQVPMKMVIGDQTMALLCFPSGSPPGHLVVHRSSLLDGLIAMFEAIWRLSTPLPGMFGARERSVSTDPPRNQDVLLLLAAGATDTSIARHLNISRRTAQRRVRALLDQLNVDTRFQAGIAAARRNWL